MRSRLIAFVLAGGLAACSSSGSTPPSARGAVAAAGRATGTLTIRYPAVRHLKLHGALRAPRFVDPAGATLVFSDAPANAQPADPSATTTIAVAPGTDGTQIATASLISGDSVLSVNEYDAGANQLATGTVFLSATAAGSSQAIAMTLYMIPVGIGITAHPDTGSDAVALSMNAASPTVFMPTLGCPGTSYPFAFDITGAWTTQFNTPLGQGGIPSPQIVSQASDKGGTSRLVSVQGGGIKIVPDGSGNGVTAHLQTFDINPIDNNITQSTSDGYVDFLPPSC